MEQQKLSKLYDCFCKESCKCFTPARDKDFIDNQITKGKILDAESHKDLLNEEFKCNSDRCWECDNVLC